MTMMHPQEGHASEINLPWQHIMKIVVLESLMTEVACFALDIQPGTMGQASSLNWNLAG